MYFPPSFLNVLCSTWFCHFKFSYSVFIFNSLSLLDLISLLFPLCILCPPVFSLVYLFTNFTFFLFLIFFSFHSYSLKEIKWEEGIGRTRESCRRTFRGNISPICQHQDPGSKLGKVLFLIYFNAMLATLIPLSSCLFKFFIVSYCRISPPQHQRTL